jgi:hypothetical protein
MAISAECDACGRKVQAPDSMAGKSVRCKQCGNIFTLPGGDEAIDNDDLGALADIERSFDSHHSHPSPRREPVVESDSDADSESEPYDFAGPIYAGRTNVFYRFPYAREVDYYLPYALAIGGVAWIAAVCFRLSGIDITWLAIVRTALAVAGYALFVAPLTLVLVRKAGRKMRFQMPSNDRWRAFAAYMPGFALAYMLWVLGHGDWVALLLGCLAGVTIATGAMALLFRLYPLEIAPTGVYGAIGFLLGVGITAGIFIGINSLLISIAVSTKNPDMLPSSLFGPGLAWVSQEDRDRIQAELNPPPKPKPAVAPATTEATASVPAAPQGTGSPIVPRYEIAPIRAGFDEMLVPAVESDFVAAVRVAADITVEPWSETKWTPLASQKLPRSNSAPENRYVLSPDGGAVARIAAFPRSSVQIFRNAQLAQVVYLDTALQFPELVGFLSNDLVLVYGKQNNASALQVLDVAANKALPLISTPRFDLGPSLTISRDGKMAALATKVDNVPTLLVYDLAGSQQIASQTIAALAPRFEVKPTGMSFSFDGAQVALLFEQQGNGLILNYRVDRTQTTTTAPAEQTLTPTAEHVFPAGPLPGRNLGAFKGNALAWLPNNRAWLIYGQGVFSVERGQLLEELKIPNVINCWVSAPNIVEAVVQNANGQKQLGVATLDMEKINAMLTPPPSPQRD